MVMEISKLSVLQKIFHIILILCTIGTIYHCLEDYLQDEDVARVNFKKFNIDENDRYPTISLCIARVRK